MLCVKQVCLLINLAGFVMKYLPLIVITGLVAGCSSVNRVLDTTNLVDYNNYKSVKLLEVPAGLDKPVLDTTYLPDPSDDIVAGKSVSLGDSVPLVDGSIAAPTASSMDITLQGSQLVLNVNDGNDGLWDKTTEALKAMGMTISGSDQATGIIQARDRGTISSNNSPIGAFLNRTLGKVNKGSEYRIMVKASTISFADKDGGVISEVDSRSLLGRLKKELVSS
jgi:uncharacterized lipoprotein